MRYAAIVALLVGLLLTGCEPQEVSQAEVQNDTLGEESVSVQAEAVEQSSSREGLQAQLRECGSIDNELDRLDCYDKLSGHDEADNAPESSSASSWNVNVDRVRSMIQRLLCFHL